jgi:hypothetical protein
LRFDRWLETHFTVPGLPERIGDLVVAVTDLETHRPWAICCEFQSEPDFDMSDRLLVLLGLVRINHKPSTEPGDRYWVGAVVVNLTGTGDARREHEWRGAGLHLLIEPRELNFSTLDAGNVLQQGEDGVAPVEALAWISLMQRGNDPAIIQRWLESASREADPERRADLGLVTVFAELANCQEAWRKALEGWNMKESQLVKEWEDKARLEGEIKGRTEGKAETLVQILNKRFKSVPDDLRATLLAEPNAQRLTDLVEIAIAARSLKTFRQKAGL